VAAVPLCHPAQLKQVLSQAFGLSYSRYIRADRLSERIEPVQQLAGSGIAASLQNGKFACAGTVANTSLQLMPRKPPVPSIPEKPTGRTKPEPSRMAPKHRPDPSPEQFDLWGAFGASWELGPMVEAAAQPRAKGRQRRGSRTP
jgi:hypothetical protein